MENNMCGPLAAEEQHSLMLIHFIDILVQNKDIGMNIDEMRQKILQLRKEQQNMLRRHERIADTMSFLDLLCKAFQSANNKMREGVISQVKPEWKELKTTSENPDDCLMTMLIERVRTLNIESDESKELSQWVSSVSQQGDWSCEKKKLLEAEMELGLQFTPALSVLEDDLINRNKLLRLERSQLEEKMKRTLAAFARTKLDLSRYENECHRLRNILQKSSSALGVQIGTEVQKILVDMKEVEKRNAAMFSQWQGHHNVLCEILDDVRMFNTQAVKDGEKIWQLCRSCKQLNIERLELIYNIRGRAAQGHNCQLDSWTEP